MKGRKRILLVYPFVWAKNLLGLFVIMYSKSQPLTYTKVILIIMNNSLQIGCNMGAIAIGLDSHMVYEQC